MTKKEMIESILQEVKSVKCSVIRVYGLSNGVGYDLIASIDFEKKTIEVDAHALRTGWAYPKHLRPNNPYYKYTGSNDVYQSQVVNFWEKKTGYTGFEGYLSELKKNDLQALYHEVMEA